MLIIQCVANELKHGFRLPDKNRSYVMDKWILVRINFNYHNSGGSWQDVGFIITTTQETVI